MKIVCDSCGAKYSIADEKVAGKVFKIRCKKCQSVMVVRGDEMPPKDESATSMVDYGGDVIWHVVVEGEQQGPYAPRQIGEMIAEGRIGWDAYVWREGFDGWVPAQDIQELVEAITGQPQGAAGQAASPSDHPTAFAQTGMGADPFAGDGAAPVAAAADAPAASAGDEEAVAARAPRRGAADLFGQAEAAASPFAGVGPDTTDQDVIASPPVEAQGSVQATGVRNENSVLFSLANLQALATGGPASASVVVGAARGAGHAGGEGSGLIDIRALASAGPSQAAGLSSRQPNVDDLLAIGGAAPIAGTLGAPLLAPIREEKSSNKIILAIVGGAVVLAAAAVVIVFVMRGQLVQPAVATAGNPIAPDLAPAAAGTATHTAVGAPAVNAEPPATTAQPSAGADGVPTPGPAAVAAERRERERSAGATRPVETSQPRPPSTSERTPPAAATTKRGSLDVLLEQALRTPTGAQAANKTSPRTPEAPPAADANLPESPSREAVLQALRSVQPAVAACGGGQHGLAITEVRVSGRTGRVSSAVVQGAPFAGTPIGSCVAHAVRGAQFPRFRRDTFNVAYPYRL